MTEYLKKKVEEQEKNNGEKGKSVSIFASRGKKPNLFKKKAFIGN